MKRQVISLIALLLSVAAISQNQRYKVSLFRAAPGRLLELIDNIKSDMDNYQILGIEKPYLMRHSQGDQWDLMLIFPIDNIDIRSNNSNTISKPFGDEFYNLISFQEDAWLQGPDKQLFNDWFKNYNYYHVEIFTSLAGKQNELLKQRKMENIYLKALDRRPNLIFTRVLGPSWDLFTLGFYDDIQDYAASGAVSFETEDQAARDAGFEGVNYIGSYLRSLILEHHDTLAGAVR